MSEPIELFAVTRVDPERFAAAQHRLFNGARLHIGRSLGAASLKWTQ
ncbi:hypothetical protein [Amycolatopsis sp. 195334CR]|nr:hypothetical protein [Amycolatopsis sp. 195334CR]MBN6040021.1 hypothetical protein [Amycolatopsis sp. 195334CR]